MSRILSYLGQDGLLHLLVSLVLCLFLSALMPLWASASITFLQRNWRGTVPSAKARWSGRTSWRTSRECSSECSPWCCWIM